MARRAGVVMQVETTVGSRRDADRLSKGALDARLAACVNEWKVRSRYWWKGKMERADEILLVFKTRAERVDSLVAWLRGNHPYEVPFVAVGRVDVRVPSYRDWVDGETREG